MTDHDDTSHTGGVIDPSILNPDQNSAGNSSDDGLGIPAFLRRDTNPVFATTENQEGQTELTVEQAPEQPSEQELLPEQAEATQPDTPQGNAALISNAPSEQAKHAEAGTEGEDDTSGGDDGEVTAGPGMGHNAPADPAEMRRDFFKDINKFGKASGEGASALGRLGLRALRAAADGVISTAKPSNGGKDDPTLIYEAYTAMDSKHSEHTAGGAKANASKLRQIVAMGCMTTLADPVAVGDRVVRIHEEMTENELKPKALFAALVDVARAQQASDTELSDAAIQECLTKTKADKTLEKEWEAIAKRVDGLITGEASHGLKDQSEAALKIGQLISEHVKNFQLEGTRLERIESMLELGYTTAQATAIVDKKIALQ